MKKTVLFSVITIIILAFLNISISKELNIRVTEVATITPPEESRHADNILVKPVIPLELNDKVIDFATLKIPVEGEIDPLKELIYVDFRPLNTSWSAGTRWSSIWHDEESGSFVVGVVSCSNVIKDIHGNFYIELSIENILQDWIDGKYPNYGLCLTPYVDSGEVRSHSFIRITGPPQLKIDYSLKVTD
ncbi:hypothetical protein JXI42_03610 [bacterium]|nr:hypothetical protein [bacterium]